MPLKVDTSEVSAAEGYKLGKITVEPQEVEVTGDKSTLAGISEINIPGRCPGTGRSDTANGSDH